MLFSKLKAYSFTSAVDFEFDSLTKSLSSFSFKPLPSSQIKTCGFVNPYSLESSDVVHGVEDCYLLCLREDSKPISSKLVNKKLAQRIAKLEQQGVECNKEKKQELKESVISELVSTFPSDFIKTKFVYALLMPELKLFLVNSTSSGDTEMFNALIRKAVGSFPVVEYSVDTLPSTVMTNWLKDGQSVPEELIVLDECQLKDPIEDKGATVTCKKQDLYTEEVESHIEGGKVVSYLTLEWNDSLVIKLRDDLVILSIRFTDLLKENLDVGDSKERYAKLDAEMSLTVGNLKMLMPNLSKLFS